MIISFTLLFVAIGCFCYKSKNEVSLIDAEQLNKLNDKNEDDDLYKDLEDLFI